MTPSEAVTVSASQSGFMVGRQGREGQDVGRPPCPPVHLWASFLPVPRGRTPQSRGPPLCSQSCSYSFTILLPRADLCRCVHRCVPMCTVTPRLPALAGGSGPQQVFFFFKHNWPVDKQFPRLYLLVARSSS